jgi:hypothetical protein
MIQQQVFSPSFLLAAAQQIDAWYHNAVFSAPDLAPLCKALTAAEYCGLFKSGSTNAIYKVARFLSDEELNWLYVNTLNPYIPFGSNGRCRGELNIFTYRKCKQMMRHELEQEKLQGRVNRERKAAEGSRRLEVMKATQEEQSAMRNLLIDRLQTLPASQRLKEIAASAHPIHFFPDYLAVLTENELTQLPQETKAMLSEKLSRAKKGKWHHLHLALNFQPPP